MNATRHPCTLPDETIANLVIDPQFFRRLLVFCVRMEGNGGLLTKAPGYIEEKWYSIMTDQLNPADLLDSDNADKLNQWWDQWRAHARK